MYVYNLLIGSKIDNISIVRILKNKQELLNPIVYKFCLPLFRLCNVMPFELNTSEGYRDKKPRPFIIASFIWQGSY